MPVIQSDPITLSYLINVDGLTIYISGFFEETGKYEIEFESLQDYYGKVDFAIVPLQGSFNNIEGYTKWLNYMVTKLNPNHIFPTFIEGYEEYFIQFADMVFENFPEIIVNCAEYPGDRFFYSSHSPPTRKNYLYYRMLVSRY